MLILNAEEVRQALPMDQAIEAAKAAYAALSSGQAEVPLRVRLPVEPHAGISLFMPAYVSDPENEALAVKIVSLFPENVKHGLATIQATVLVLDVKTGRAAAILEGGSLTAIRTGAASGAATDLLARPDSSTAAIFGAGVQGRTQLEAVCTARNIETVWIYDPSPNKMEAMIAELGGKGPIPTDLRPASDPTEAVQDADILCLATTSLKPVYQDADLKAGVHINAVGSYTPDMIETPTETVVRSALFVDSRSAVLSEAGEIIASIKQGLIDKEHIQAEIGELVLGTHPGRQNSEQITYFKSVGVAVQDAIAGRLALKNSKKMGLGQEIEW